MNQIVENFNSVTGGQEHTGRRQPQLDGAVPQEPLVGRDHEGEDREEGPHRARLRNRHRQGSRFPGGGDTQLRSPHNSHVDVFARMGLIGLGIWLVVRAFFFFTALRTAFRLIANGPDPRDRLRQRLHRGGNRDLGRTPTSTPPSRVHKWRSCSDSGGAHVRARGTCPPPGRHRAGCGRGPSLKSAPTSTATDSVVVGIQFPMNGSGMSPGNNPK